MLIRTDYLIDIDRETGEYIQGWARIKQSIVTILTTRLKTRFMRLWWGSEFLDMQDKPANAETFVQGISAAAKAINDYEPEFKVERIIINELGPTGAISITIEGLDLVDSARRRLSTTL
jgi:phage baseplate assembly protein W